MYDIRVILIILLCRKTYCQDGYSEPDMLHYHQMAENDGQVESITGYSTNIGQRESNQLYSSGNLQYQAPDDSNKNDDYNRHDRARSRKVYRIKNPFQHKEDTEKSQDQPNDVGTSASNQYAAIQYSLPPEQFLAQMKSENQYQQQYSTPSTLSYTATPQPQYQYSTMSASGYDNSPQSNYNTRAETRTYTPTYNNNYQYNNNANSYSQDTIASTPLPTFLSTSLPSNQYLGTSANSYLSSPASVYLSSPQSIAQYVSSPVSFDYNGNRVSTIGSDSLGFHNNEVNKRMQIDHYDNSGNGVRFPNNVHNQYQNEFPSSTVSPTSSYYENKQDSWPNNAHTDLNTLSKSIQDNQAQYNNLRYNSIQSANKQDSSVDAINSDTHRIGSMPAANNVYLNFAKPDYQVLNNYKSRPSNSEQETGSTPVYSHGDFGWKLSDKKPNYAPEVTTTANQFRYQIHSVHPETGVYSQVNFQMDSGKEYSYEQTTKPSSEKIDAEEFARAAAKAHENYKQQLKASNYATNSQYNSNYFANNPYLNSYFIHSNKQKQNYDDVASQNIHGTSQPEFVTASPYYYTSSRENLIDNKPKSPFDHDKALKNIVPIDVSNVVSHTNGLVRVNTGTDSINKINIANYGKDHTDLIQQSTPANDPVYYKDKNSFYTINFKPKSEDLLGLDRYKQSDSIGSYYGKEQNFDSSYNSGGYFGNKRFIEDATQRANINQLQANQDSLLSSANIQQSLHRPTPQPDMSGFLKFNDIPHRITEAYPVESLRYNNNFDQSSLPSPLPLRLNQNVDNHHLDVASEILNKIIANKANLNRPEMDSQGANSLSSINGFKISNPYNIDLKLVADMLKGKSAIDDSQMLHLRDQYDKPSLPLKLDVSQLQQMLHLKNDNNPLGLGNSISAIGNPFYDFYNGGRFPYQGVKYSRSEEEAENIPIADASNNLSIGAVLDEEDTINIPEESTITEHQEDNIPSNIDSDKSRAVLDTSSREQNTGKKHFSIPYSSRHSHTRKYPKSEVNEPYPLLKPPPPSRQSRYGDKNRRRLHKHKILRVFKTEPLFEANAMNVEEFNSKSHVHSSGFADQNSDNNHY